MEYLIIAIICFISIIILALILGITPQKIKEIKKIGFDKELNEITNKLPENKIVCEQILKKLNNATVKIREEEGKQASLYLIVTNSILIANIKNTFTRIQTIAHECIHSCQDKKLLWFNYIFSNVYILYSIVIIILALLKKLNNNMIYLFMLAIMGIVFYFVRSYLEADAMIKAKFLAKEYMEENKNLIPEKNINLIIDKYEYLNSLGIKFTLFCLILNPLIKIMVFCIAYCL